MLTIELDAVYTGQSQGAGRESTRNLWNVCSRMLQGTEKASSLGSRRRLDNVSQDNRVECVVEDSAAGRRGGCVGRRWVVVVVVVCRLLVCVRACVRVPPPLLVQTLGARRQLEPRGGGGRDRQSKTGW